MFKLLIVSAVCIGSSLAQVEQGAACQTSQGEQFQNCLRDFALDIDIFWNHQPPNVEFAFEMPDDGWHAFGFSGGEAGFSMFPSNIVIGCVDGTPVGDYEIFGGRAQGPALANNQGLEGLQETRVNGICTIEFTRPIDAQLEIQNEEQTLNDQFVRTIVASGGPQLAQHTTDDRQSFDVNYQQGVGAASSLSVSITLMTAIAGAALASLLQ